MSTSDRFVFSLSNVPKAAASRVVRSRASESEFREGHKWAFPPPNLMQYRESVDAHIITGKRDYSEIATLLRNHQVVPSFVLDLACSNARVLRWFDEDESVVEAWGVDIDASRIAWCLANLSGKLRFAGVTSVPHLPFADGYFDLVIAISIFTHLDDTWTGWICELRRVVKLGGHILITLNDEACARQRMEANDLVGKILKSEPEFAAFMDEEGLYSFHNNANNILFTAIKSEFFLKVIRPFFEVASVVSIMGGQSGYFLRRVS